MSYLNKHLRAGIIMKVLSPIENIKGERLMHQARVFSLVILFLLSNMSSAANEVDSDVLTVEVAAGIAVRDNPGLAAMQARYEAMAEVPSQKSTLPDPMLMIGAMNFPTDSYDRDQEAMTQMQIGFSQVFPFPGKLGFKEEAAEFEAKAALFSVDEMRLKLINNVVSKWWQVYYLDRALETIDINQSLLRQFIEVAKTKYETGKGLQQDVLLSQLELSKLMDKKIHVESLRRNQVIRLNVLMDRPPHAKVVLPEAASKPMPSLLSENDLYVLAEKSRPLLKGKEQSVSAAESRLNLAKRDYYPDFKVTAVYGERDGDNPMPMGGDRSDFLSVMVGVKIPLYGATKQSKAVKQRTNEHQRSRYALLDEKSQVMAGISSAVTDYEQALQQISLFKDGIIPQAKQTVQSMLSGYQVSEVDFLNLVRSQVTLFNYELQYWKALTEANQALSRLKAAVGEETIYE